MLLSKTFLGIISYILSLCYNVLTMAKKTYGKEKYELPRVIDEDVKTGSFKRVYLLFGEESYLKRQKKEKLLNALRQPDDNMNFTAFEGKGIDVSQIIDLAETMPFLAEYRVILVENSQFFKTSAPDALVDYLETIPESTCLIFCEEEVDKRGRLYKAVTKTGAAAEYQHPDADTLSKWVLGRVAKEQKKISEATLQAFLLRCGNDLEFASNELDKLFCYTLEKDCITTEDLDAICSGQPTDDIFDMVNAFSTGDAKKAFSLYYGLLQKKETPFHILLLVIRQFNLLLQIKDLREQGFDVKTIADRLGSRDWIIRKNLSQAGSFSIEQLKSAVRDGVAAEEAFKTGRMDERSAVELFLTKYA